MPSFFREGRKECTELFAIPRECFVIGNVQQRYLEGEWDIAYFVIGNVQQRYLEGEWDIAYFVIGNVQQRYLEGEWDIAYFVIGNAKKSLKFRQTRVTEGNLVSVATVLSVVMITGGAAVFSKYEGWEYFDSTYYCFITLSTIGFGDYVALQHSDALGSKPEYVAFSLFFILFGLTVVAATVNLLVLRFVTLNTQDERKDELAAIQSAQGAVRLEGDIITTNGEVLNERRHRERSSLSEIASVCSCTYSCFDQRGGLHKAPGPRRDGLCSLCLPLRDRRARRRAKIARHAQQGGGGMALKTFRMTPAQRGSFGGSSRENDFSEDEMADSFEAPSEPRASV
ncbi:unnamed protein product [Cyprideis torosa]|uniref:Potassium channel domain-containing protein n=1 Tax=Cyprideis torosa TaxID=163714 RepID=A0A7R8ZQF9_9CRUS|nr:unnamed protein product [Cyprideis torosa]CAG0902773.1 unnamed protein product [Cyprideis torosa]